MVVVYINIYFTTRHFDHRPTFPNCTMNDQPGDKELNDILRHVSEGNGGDDSSLRLTKEEGEKFRRAFNDSEFRKLMSDYVSEISDPKSRAEQDAYIQQLEKENGVPAGKIIVRPETKNGFVLKYRSTKHTKGRQGKTEKSKIFVNVVSSEHISKPSFKVVDTSIHGQASGKQWSVPSSLGPMRMEADKAGNLVPTFDSCYHPDTLRFAANFGFRDMLARMISESLVKSYLGFNEEISVDAAYRVLRNVVYVNGTPPVMLISANGETNTSGLNCAKTNVENSENKTTKMMGDAPAKNVGNLKEKNQETVSTAQQAAGGVEHEMKNVFLMKERKTTRKDKKTLSNKLSTDFKSEGNGDSNGREDEMVVESANEVPEYTISERSEFDIGDHTLAGVRNTDGNVLVVRVKLPEISTSSEIDLLMNDERIVLKSLDESKSNYFLEIELPRIKVNSGSGGGKAAWDKASKILTLTLPIRVHQSPKIIVDTEKGVRGCDDQEGGQCIVEDSMTPKTSNTSTAKDEGDKTRHTRWVKAADSSVSFHEKQIAPDVSSKERKNREVDNEGKSCSPTKSRDLQKWNEYCKKVPVENIGTVPSPSFDSESDSDYVHVEPVLTAFDHTKETPAMNTSTGDCNQDHHITADDGSSHVDSSSSSHDTLKNLIDHSPVVQSKMLFTLD